MNKDVIMQCPRCKTRKQITFDEWVKYSLPLSLNRLRCTNTLCDKNIMLYHKDAN